MTIPFATVACLALCSVGSSTSAQPLAQGTTAPQDCAAEAAALASTP